MKKALALLAILGTSGHTALARGTIVTCDTKNIVNVGGDLIDLTIMHDTNPTDTLLGGNTSPNDAVIIFCRNGQLIITANGEKPIRMVLTPQEGATISQEQDCRRRQQLVYGRFLV
jgi:hypothetical protein